MIKYIMFLAITSCTTYIPDKEPIVDSGVADIKRSQQDASQADVVRSSNVTCEYVREHWGHDCIFVEYKCDDDSFRLKAICSPQTFFNPEDIPEPYKY